MSNKRPASVVEKVPLFNKEDESCIKKRLLNQTSMLRQNMEAPLRRLAKRYAFLCAAAEGTSPEAVQRQYEQFARELALFQFQIQRGETQVLVNVQEQADYGAMQTSLEEQINNAKSEIEQLKLELEGARRERRHKEEYEVLRKECMQHDSRTSSQLALKQLEEEIASLEAEGRSSQQQIDARREAFGALLARMDELEQAAEGKRL